MHYATRFWKHARHAASFVFHFAHGSLLIVGIAAIAFIGVRLTQDGVEGFSIAGVTGVGEARAAVSEVDQTDPEGDLSPEMERIVNYVARRYRVSEVAIEPLIASAQQIGRNVGVDPLLIIAVMAIESSFNPFAQSPMGAQGLMQVIPRFHTDKVDVAADEGALLDPATNIRVGALVLKESIRRAGSLEAGLQQYGGVVDDPAASYANRVIAEKQRLAEVMRKSGRASIGT